MPLVDYTSFDDIRAALGVSDEEIDDATLSLPVYEYHLTAELEDADTSADLVGSYGTVKAISSADRSRTQQQFYEAMRLLTTYTVAKHLTSTLPLFSPKEQTDGKASMVRYATDPYKATIKSVEALYEKSKVRALDRYSKLNTPVAQTASVMTYISTSSSAYDPVTGA